MSNIFKYSIVLFLFTLVLSCGSEDDSDDGTNTDIASSISTVGEQASLTSPSRAECKTIGFLACDTATKTRTRFFSAQGGDVEPCTKGKSNGFNTYGKSVLTFSDAACAFATAGDTVKRSVSMYEQRGLAGRKVLIYSGVGSLGGATITEEDVKDYDGVVRSGGAEMTFQSDVGGVRTYNLLITGTHRLSIKPNGKRGHHHLHYTTDAGMTVVHDTVADSYTLTGVMFVSDVRKKRTFKKTYTTVKVVPPCRHPQSGTVLFEEVGGTEKFTVTFNSTTCGAGNIDNSAVDFEDSES